MTVLFIFGGALISCGNSERKPTINPPPATPQALQDHQSALGEVKLGSSSSREVDLVESLYRELVKNDSALTALEAGMDRLQDERTDSSAPFNVYNGKSDEYYGAAHAHAGKIKDSILRKRMEVLVAGSDTAYRTMTSRHRQLLAAIEGRDLSVDDLHEVLKLTRTLPVMEQYQKGHLPRTEGLQRVFREYEKLVRQEEGLIKK